MKTLANSLASWTHARGIKLMELRQHVEDVGHRSSVPEFSASAVHSHVRIE